MAGRARQIVHMDLKSPNVLLQDRNCLVAKIADLGLSRQLAEGSLLTNAGHGAPSAHLTFVSLLSLFAGYCMVPAYGIRGLVLLVGTRAYMAPELVHMRDERLAYPWALDVYRHNPRPCPHASWLSNCILFPIAAASCLRTTALPSCTHESRFCLAALECCCMRWSVASVRTRDVPLSPSGALLVDSPANARYTSGHAVQHSDCRSSKEALCL